MPPTSDVLLLALIVLVAAVVAARAYFSVRALLAASVRVRVQSEALDDAAPRAARWFVDARGSLSDVNTGIERGLSGLARLDGVTVRATEDLAERRATLEEVRTRRLVAAADMLARARTTARVVSTGLKLRRSLGA